jgi:shikimate dehydrogenase
VFNRLSGATRLFPIIGDPIKYVESPMRLTRTFGERDHDGICVPMQVPANDLDAVMAGLTASRNVDGILVTMPHKFTAFAYCAMDCVKDLGQFLGWLLRRAVALVVGEGLGWSAVAES